MTAVRRVTPAAERRMRARVNATLGEWTRTVVAPAQQAAPAPPQAATSPTDAFAVAQATVEAMQQSQEEERRHRDDRKEILADAFLKGTDVTARQLTDVNGDPTYTRFLRTQKGKIM